MTGSRRSFLLDAIVMIAVPEAHMALQSEALEKVELDALRIAARFWIDFWTMALNPFSYVPFWEPLKRKDPAG